MGVISNILKTTFTSKGAEKVAAQTEHVGRAQTRLGQASAATGRQFAAQSAGLGGLVGAYAGAAATIFALQAAFDALARAAANENIIKGTSALAAETAQSGPAILNTMKDITQSQITLAEASQNANIALSAGFNTEQIEGLTRVSLSASKALGRNLTDSLQRVVRGTAKLEPELLDELGIFVKLGPATRKYADELGVAVSSLSEFERRQAFANAAIEEGTRKFGAINTSVPSAQKSLEQLQTTLTELSNDFLLFIAQAIQPFVDFINGDASIAINAFAILLTLVLNKSFQSLVGPINAFSSALTTSEIRLSSWAQNSKKNMKDVGIEVENLQKKIDARGGISGSDKKSGRFNQKGIRGPALDRAREAARIRNAFLKEETLSIQQQKNAVATLTVAQKDLAKAGLKTSAAYADAGIIATAYRKNIDNTSSAALRASKAFTIAAAGVRGFAKALSIGLNAIFGITTALGVLSLFGIDVIGGLTKLFTDSRKKSELLSVGVAGVVSAIAGGSEEIALFLKSIGKSDEQISNFGATFGDSLIDSIRNAESTVTDLGNNPQKIISKDRFEGQIEKINAAIEKRRDALVQAQIAGDKERIELRTRQLKSALASGNTEIQRLEDEIVSLGFVDVIEDLALVQLRGKYDELKKTIAEGGKGITTAQAEQLKEYELKIKTFEQFTLDYISVLASLAGSTGLSTEKIAESFKNSDVFQFDRETNSLIAFGRAIKLTGDAVKDLSNFSENEIAIIENSALISTTLKETTEAYLAGASGITQLSQAIAGLESAISKSDAAVEKQKAALIALGVDASIVSKLIVATTEEQRKSLQGLIDARDELQVLDTINKGVSSVFGGDISQLKNISFKGLVNSAGIFAKTQKEINSNQLTLLATAKRLSQEEETQLDTLKSNVNRSDEQQLSYTLLNAKAETYNKVLEAIAGKLLNARLELAKMVKEQKELLKNLKTENELLLTKTNLEISNASLALANAKQDIINDQLDAQITQLKEINGLEQKRSENLVNRLTALNDLQQNEDAKIPGGLIEERVNQIKNDATLLTLTVEAEEAFNSAIEAISAGKESNLSIIALEEALLRDKQNKAIEVFNLETRAIETKLEGERLNLEAQRSIVQATADLDVARIKATRDAIIAEANLMLQQIENYKDLAKIVQTEAEITGEKAKVVNAFGIHVVELSKVLNSYIQALPGAVGDGVATASFEAVKTGESIGANLLSEIGATAKSAQDLLGQTVSEQLKTTDIQIRATEEIAKKQIEILDAQIADVESKLNELPTKRATEGNKILADLEAEQDQLQQRRDEILSGLGDTGSDGDDVENAVKDMLTSVFDGIQGAINTAITSFGNFILYGEGSLSDIFANLFKSIQQTLFEETISKPLSNFFTEQILGISKKGIENATVNSDGSLNVNVSNFAQMAIPQINGDKGTDIFKNGESTKGVFGNIFDKITGMFSNLFGEGGVLSKIFSGITSIFSGGSGGGGGFLAGLFKGIFSLFGMAQGGMVHMAQGGGVNSLRDRVPTMLEPGEFVIRKPMARQIGTPALQAMNATGSMPQGDVQVNINNQGTPQDAKASAPKFDGEKYVIDIVTRDLSNNGPIRRSLRGGR